MNNLKQTRRQPSDAVHAAQFGVSATMLSSTTVGLQYPKWSSVTSLTVTIIVSSDAVSLSCFFERAYINAINASPSYSIPTQNLSTRSISLIGLEQYFPLSEYNWSCSLNSTYCTPLSAGTFLHVLFFTNMTCTPNSSLTVLTYNTAQCTCESGFHE